MVGDRLDLLARIVPLPGSVRVLRPAWKNDGTDDWSSGSASVAVVAVESPPLVRAVLSVFRENVCLIAFPPLGGLGK